MGDLTFIKDGYATTMHSNGDVTVVAAQYCDVCFTWQTALGGRQVRDLTGEVIMWMCSGCRA